MKQLIAVMLVMLSIGSALAQQAKPAPAGSSDAVEQLITGLGDPVLREQLLEHLRAARPAKRQRPPPKKPMRRQQRAGRRAGSNPLSTSVVLPTPPAAYDTQRLPPIRQHRLPP